MDEIRDWNDIAKYGIQMLTGESCAYGLRLLCDINEDGQQLLENYFSVSITLARAWNPTVNGNRAVGSIMIPSGILKQLAKFLLFHVDGCYGCWVGDDRVIGLSEEEYKEYLKEDFTRSGLYLNFAYRQTDNRISVDGRNVHQISGRAA